MTSKKSIVSERVRMIKGLDIREFLDLAQRTERIISLGVGEPDFVTPWSIREACLFSLKKGYTSYTSNWGLPELREAISKKTYKESSVDYNPEDEILITTGVSEALDLALRAIINPGEEVILHVPSYVSYKPCVTFAGGVAVSVATAVEDEFKLRAEKIEEKITEKTKALILNYPNNPTGATMVENDLEEIAEVVNEHDLLVISDEIYGKLTYEGKYVPFSSLNGMKHRTILLNGFSKAYAMTGFRLGYAMGPKEIIEAMMKIHQYTMLCAPITAQMAALEALTSRSDGYVEEMISEYNRRRRLMVEGLREIGLSCFEPKGAFYAFPSIKKTELTSGKFARDLLTEEKVVVIPGSVFGNAGESFIRCSYAVSRQKIKEALLRMQNFLEKQKKC